MRPGLRKPAPAGRDPTDFGQIGGRLRCKFVKASPIRPTASSTSESVVPQPRLSGTAASASSALTQADCAQYTRGLPDARRAGGPGGCSKLRLERLQDVVRRELAEAMLALPGCRASELAPLTVVSHVSPVRRTTRLSLRSRSLEQALSALTPPINSAATALPTQCATGRVPERRPFCCPPR